MRCPTCGQEVVLEVIKLWSYYNIPHGSFILNGIKYQCLLSGGSIKQFVFKDGEKIVLDSSNLPPLFYKEIFKLLYEMEESGSYSSRKRVRPYYEESEYDFLDIDLH